MWCKKCFLLYTCKYELGGNMFFKLTCGVYIYVTNTITPLPHSHPFGKHAVLKFEWIVLNLCIVILRNQRNLTSEHNHFFFKAKKKKRNFINVFHYGEKWSTFSFPLLSIISGWFIRSSLYLFVRAETRDQCSFSC